jgi:hypothetical protein
MVTFSGCTCKSIGGTALDLCKQVRVGGYSIEYLCSRYTSRERFLGLLCFSLPLLVVRDSVIDEPDTNPDSDEMILLYIGTYLLI